MAHTIHAERARHKERQARSALLEARTMAEAALADYRCAGEPHKAEAMQRLRTDLNDAYVMLINNP